MNPEGGKIVVVDTSLSVKDFFQAQARVLLLLFLILVVIGASTWSIGLARLILIGEFTQLLMAIAPLFIGVSIFTGLLWWRVAKLDDFCKNIQYTFNDSGMDVKTDRSYSHLDWSGVSKFIETKEAFYVYISQALTIVPKRFFLQPEDLVNLRSLARQALAKKAQLFDSPTPGLSKIQWVFLSVVVVVILASIIPPFILPSSIGEYLAQDFYNRGYRLYKQDQYTEARKELNAALTLNHKLGRAHELRGDINVDEENYAAAEVDYTAALASCTCAQAHLYHDRAWVRVELGKLKEARADLKKALALYKQDDDEENYNEILDDLKRLDKGDSAI